MRIAIVAALPGELKPLVKDWQAVSAVKRGEHIWQTQKRNDTLIAACAGMGAEAVRRAFAAAESHGPIDLLMSVGWAGALDTGMRTGECYIPSEIIDAQTGERFLLTDSRRSLRLVTTASVADTQEKQRLWKSYSAAMVDMEAATIARLAQMRGIPVCCFKGISDGVGANLPDLNPYIDRQGQMRLAPFLMHVAGKPRNWHPLFDLGRNSARAAVSIAAKINKFLIDKDIQRTNRTGAV